MRILLFLIFLLNFSAICFAQIHLQKCDNKKLSVDDIVKKHFLKSGIKILKISSRIHPNGVGIFSDPKNLLGISDGIVLATGSIDSIPGPNNRFGTSSRFPGFIDYHDEDFVTGHHNYDAMVIHIEFIPSFDSICFDYCFGSEEYPEFERSEFNDLFELSLKMHGTHYSNNLAKLPNGMQVCVNLVNHKMNKEYFIDNMADYVYNKFEKKWEPLNQQLFDTYEYDGFTKLLTAGSRVMPGKTYELKIIICDLNDANFDSGVFLRSKSFRSISSKFDAKKARFKKFVFNFEVASTLLDSAITSSFPDISDYILKNKIDSVFISGHTDSTGIEDSNIVLSLNRAEHVKQLLIIAGIPESKIITRGRGSRFPIKPNATFEGRMMNRRVEIYFYKR